MVRMSDNPADRPWPRRPAAPEQGPWQEWPAGARVVVRRRLSDAESAATGRKVTDILGVVVTAGPAGVVLTPDAGRRVGRPQPEVTVAAADIVAAKRVPQRPVRLPRPPPA